MRKMATVRKIDDIQQIENADAIEKAVVGGWNVVVKSCTDDFSFKVISNSYLLKRG